MNSNGILQKHWLNVSFHCLIDALLFILAFVVGTELRFTTDGEVEKHLVDYLPSIIWGALGFPCLAYISGLYSPHVTNDSLFRRSIVLGLCFLLAFGFMVAVFYVNYSSKIGRGVMLISGLLSYGLILFHHTRLLHRMKNYRERVALIVTCAFDEMESELLEAVGARHLELVGLIHYDDYRPTSKHKVLGSASDLSKIVERERLDRVVCTDKSINDPAMCRQFCQLRYSGVTVMPLISLCEEVYQSVPLELITPEWLMHASDLPHILYIRKVKRAFDIVASLFGLVFFSPFLIFGMLATKLTSPGPVFYHQTRAGRFGKPFKVIKLRTMRTDAEKNGAVWAASNDARVTPVGGFMRKYRIDEIPQIINVLRGEMSFVGPRPERPEFIDMLGKQIPYFGERLMVQPGITGWAQVSFPYGASVDDAKRKLEYDLYYTKHMSLFLDVFILLDTVRIILRGGVSESSQMTPAYDTAFKRRAEMKSSLAGAAS